MNINLFWESLDDSEKDHLVRLALNRIGKSEENLTLITDWLKTHAPSPRLFSTLTLLMERYKYIEQIMPFQIQQMRGAGRKTRIEFEMLLEDE